MWYGKLRIRKADKMSIGLVVMSPGVREIMRGVRFSISPAGKPVPSMRRPHPIAGHTLSAGVEPPPTPRAFRPLADPGGPAITKRSMMSRTDQTGVQWCRFRVQDRDSGS